MEFILVLSQFMEKTSKTMVDVLLLTFKIVFLMAVTSAQRDSKRCALCCGPFTRFHPGNCICAFVQTHNHPTVSFAGQALAAGSLFRYYNLEGGPQRNWGNGILPIFEHMGTPSPFHSICRRLSEALEASKISSAQAVITQTTTWRTIKVSNLSFCEVALMWETPSCPTDLGNKKYQIFLERKRKSSLYQFRLIENKLPKSVYFTVYIV